jgi:hypothetical protein
MMPAVPPFDDAVRAAARSGATPRCASAPEDAHAEGNAGYALQTRPSHSVSTEFDFDLRDGKPVVTRKPALT